MVRRLALLAALGLLLPLAGAEDDGWRWDPMKKHLPVKGYRSFRESVDTDDVNATVTQAGAVTKKEKTCSKIVFRYEHEVLAVEDGVTTKARVTIGRWKRGLVGEEPDTCLEGKTFLVTGRGDEVRWECEDAKAELTDEGKAWLEKTFKRRAEAAELAKVIFPKEPVAPGAAWTCDASVAAKAVMGADAELDGDSSSVTGKLSEMKIEKGVHVGRAEVKVVLAVKSRSRFPDGARMECRIVIEGSFDEDKREASTTETTIDFSAERPREGDEQTRIKLETRGVAKTKVGPVEDAPPARK